MSKIKNTKGYTLIELLLALGLIMILAIGIFFIYEKVNNNQKAIAISKEISSMVAQSQTLTTTSHGRNLINELDFFDNFPDILDTSFIYDDIFGEYIMPTKDTLRISVNPVSGGQRIIVFDVKMDHNKDANFCTTVANSTVNYEDLYYLRINGFTIISDDEELPSHSEIKKMIVEQCYEISKTNSGQSNSVQFWVK